MGANMARRLKDRGFHVTSVYDTNRAAATELASELGCAAAQDLSEVTAAADVVFTVVTDDKAMRQIFAGSGDNLLVNARDKLFVNCATISPKVHVEIEKLANKAGAQSLEACMASSITQAREGKLYAFRSNCFWKPVDTIKARHPRIAEHLHGLAGIQLPDVPGAGPDVTPSPL